MNNEQMTFEANMIKKRPVQVKQRKTKKSGNKILSFLAILFFLAFLFVLFLYFKKEKPVYKDQNVYETKASIQKAFNATVMIKPYNAGIYNSGSGFVYKVDGRDAYVLTNEHVVLNQKILKLKNTKGKEFDGVVLGKDKYLDIAVIKIDSSDVVDVAKINSDEKEKLAEKIYAIGTPISENYFNSVSSGIISGLNRKVELSVLQKNDWIQNTIQIDAAINPGNSGGPLVNERGEVIGINSIKLVDKSIEGISFAIKINDALRHIDELEKGKAINRPTLGIQYIDVINKRELKRNKLEVPANLNEGVVVLKVVRNSSAAKAGLITGDLIYKINGERVYNQAYLKYILYKYKPNDVVKLELYRNNRAREVNVRLG